MKRKRQINGKGLKKGEFITIFAVITVIALVKASANTIFANPPENNQVIVNNQGCLYTTQLDNHLSTPDPLPLDVVVFIDETDSARTIDPALPVNNNIPFRYQLLHLIANFLLLDSELRGVMNYLSVMVYSSDTVELQGRLPVNAGMVGSLEQYTNYNLTNRSYVDFKKLFEAIKTSVQVADDGLPVVLLINDPYPNGGDVPGSGFATTAYEDWQAISTEYEKKASIYWILAARHQPG